ncbi:MAG TPA: hypothetical protein VFO39_18645 [Candidatus Sulfotelmatobacter sp.]|nr:hypothetical protein [Candidatus Sulfotelmatobacter sp.]
MIRSLLLVSAISFAFDSISASAQNIPSGSPQAISLAAQSLAALSGGVNISDITLTGNVTWEGNDSGTATLKALGTAESRIDLVLSSGTRTELRDAQTGVATGKWINPSHASGVIAFQNCQTDAAWFFPALGSLAVGSNIVLSYIGQETRNGIAVQHIQSYVYQPNSVSIGTTTTQQLSTTDFYLDATTLLPLAVIFNAHPDTDTGVSLPIEVDFSNYQTIGGVVVPMHIQRFQQGHLLLDAALTGASFNTGLTLSTFAIN